MPSEAPVRAGEVLAGKYRVERVLGLGGMGVVVAAMHIQLEERVAIKFLLPEALQNPDTVARFAREARAAVRIKNEHVARVSDVGTLDSGAPFMVMEYLEGQDLSDVVKSRGPLPVHEALDYLLQTCEAIAEAHSLGIVHRDLKPSNLFLTRGSDGAPLVKVLDFGISKVKPRGASMQEAALTKTASVMGSPLYMAPEQMVSTRDVDARADIWALGVVLYQLLAATAPFSGDTMTELCARILQEPPPPLSNVRSDVHPGLEAALLRCLEKERDRRYASVAELVTALAPFAGAYSRVSVDKVIRMAGSASMALAMMPTSVSEVFHLPQPQSGTPQRAPSPQALQPGFPAQISTQSSWGQTAGAQSSSSGRLWLVAGIGGAAVFAGALVGIIFVFVARGKPSTVTAATSAPTHVTATTLEEDTPVAPLSHTPIVTTTMGVGGGAVTRKPPPPPSANVSAPPPTVTVTPVPTVAPTHVAPPATAKPDIF